MLVGTRYPTLAFHTGGVGQADDGIPPQPEQTVELLYLGTEAKLLSARNNGMYSHSK